MNRYLVLCAADLSYLPETRNILETFCKVHYISPTPQALEENLPNADAYFASLHVRLTDALIEKAPNLKVIATPSTGLDHLDIQAANRRGIPVLGLKDDRELLDRITSTAELAWGLILACSRSIPAAFQAVQKGVRGRGLISSPQSAHKTLGGFGLGPARDHCVPIWAGISYESHRIRCQPGQITRGTDGFV
jgi:D-3-phosphoglycerate dehydrogenase / 2-oxoglutarate reductase